MQPAALDDHLHQVADTDGCNEPTFIGSHIQHRLRKESEESIKFQVDLS